MKISFEKKDILRFFIVGLFILVFLYLIILWIGYEKLVPIIINKPEHNIYFLKSFLVEYLLPLFAILAFSFYVIEMKEMYILSGIIAFNLFFEYAMSIINIDTQTLLITVFIFLMMLLIFIFPLVDYLCHGKKKVQVGYLIISYIVTSGSELILTYYRSEMKYTIFYIVRSVLILSILLFTLHVMHLRFEVKHN